MDEIPMKANVGCAIGLIAGAFCFGIIALEFQATEDGLITMGLYVLIACLFFALAGAFSKNGQWNSDMLTLMIFLTMGIIAAFAISSYVDMYFAVVLELMAAILLFDGILSKSWIDRRA